MIIGELTYVTGSEQERWMPGSLWRGAVGMYGTVSAYTLVVMCDLSNSIWLEPAKALPPQHLPDTCPCDGKAVGIYVATIWVKANQASNVTAILKDVFQHTRPQDHVEMEDMLELYDADSSERLIDVDHVYCDAASFRRSSKVRGMTLLSCSLEGSHGEYA